MTNKLAPADRRRAQIARLKASLIVPQHVSIKTAQRAKQKPASGVMASV